jgi:Lon protease-like protein
MQIPLFPLGLLPLPDELVSLHIFEPRYRQLLADAETHDINFGIYCNHELNKLKLGGVMKLESVVKKYPTGESDIVVRCVDTFSLQKMYRSYKTKPYPGGDLELWNADLNEMGDASAYDLFLEFQTKRNITNHSAVFNLFQIAAELNLDLFDRYKFLTFTYEKKLQFIQSQLKFHLHLLNQEEKSKDLFHLN